MKRAILLGLLLVTGSLGVAQAQSPPTKIIRIEVDQEEVKTSYKVLFLLNGNWFEAENTPTGFIAPKEVRDQQKLTLRFIFDNYDLEFSDLDRSALSTDWVVGVDLAPYSEEYVKPDETDGLTGLYYIEFESHTGLGTVHVYTTRSAAK